MDSKTEFLLIQGLCMVEFHFPRQDGRCTTIYTILLETGSSGMKHIFGHSFPVSPEVRLFIIFYMKQASAATAGAHMLA